MSQSSRYRHRSWSALGRQDWLASQRKFGAFSRSVDWVALGKGGVFAAGVVGLWLWHWELLVATGLGIGAMGGIYLAYELPWEQYLEELYQLWRGTSQRLLVSVLGGASTVFVSYLAIALWQSTANHWLVTACLIQAVMIAAILWMTLRQNWGTASQSQQFETALKTLGDRSNIKRLYAIRQLRQLFQQNRLTTEQKQTLYTFLRLAWQQETDTSLREALLSALSLYKPQKQTQPPVKPSPLQLQQSRPPLRLERLQQPVRERV